MSGFIGVYSIEPGTRNRGPRFDPAAVVSFVSRWSLTSAGDDHYLAPANEHGYQSEVSASADDGLTITRPTTDDFDRAVDFMITVGGTIAGSSSPFISRDPGWLSTPLEVPGAVFVVADAAGAHEALHLVPPPQGTWDVRTGCDAVPRLLRRPAAGRAPELRWNGLLVIAHTDRIDVQQSPRHGYWGVETPDLQPGLRYEAAGWTISEDAGTLRARRGDQLVTVDTSGRVDVTRL